jgi:energy-converting hydrogenase Eha subunit F
MKEAIVVLMAVSLALVALFGFLRGSARATSRTEPDPHEVQQNGGFV